jgi:hypothetical protein
MLFADRGDAMRTGSAGSPASNVRVSRHDMTNYLLFAKFALGYVQ